MSGVPMASRDYEQRQYQRERQQFCCDSFRLPICVCGQRDRNEPSSIPQETVEFLRNILKPSLLRFLVLLADDAADTEKEDMVLSCLRFIKKPDKLEKLDKVKEIDSILGRDHGLLFKAYLLCFIGAIGKRHNLVRRIITQAQRDLEESDWRLFARKAVQVIGHRADDCSDERETCLLFLLKIFVQENPGETQDSKYFRGWELFGDAIRFAFETSVDKSRARKWLDWYCGIGTPTGDRWPFGDVINYGDPAQLFDEDYPGPSIHKYYDENYLAALKKRTHEKLTADGWQEVEKERRVNEFFPKKEFRVYANTCADCGAQLLLRLKGFDVTGASAPNKSCCQTVVESGERALRWLI